MTSHLVLRVSLKKSAVLAILCLAAVLVVVGLALDTNLAQADSIQISTSDSSIVEDMPLAVSVTGTVQHYDGWQVYSKPDNPPGCTSSPDNDPTAFSEFGDSFASESFSGSDTIVFKDPGNYLICAYSGKSPYVAISSAKVLVRQNTASLHLRTQKKIRIGSKLRIKISGSSEVKREVYVAVKHAGPTRCRASYPQEPQESLIFYNGEPLEVSGRFDDTLVTNELTVRGKYLVCAWVQEGSDDVNPDAVATTSVRVKSKHHR